MDLITPLLYLQSNNMLNNTFAVGPVNFPNYLLVVARKVSTPTIIAEQHSYGPAPTNFNAVFTTLEPTNYYVDFRDSVDGTDIGILINTFIFDAQTNQIIAERRYYTCGGPNVGDPAAGANTIVDTYFVGKNVSGMFKEGFRYLVPVTEFTINDAGDTLTNITGSVWGVGEVIEVEISYKDALPVTAGSTLFPAGNKLITANVTIDNTYIGARTRCAGLIATLVITFPNLAGFAEGSQFYFQSFGGMQNQTRILMTGTDRITWDGLFSGAITELEFPEFWLGRGEWVMLQLVTTGGTKYLEVINAHEGIAKVGEKCTLGFVNHPNTIPEDARLMDGAEWPRLWWWLNNIAPAAMILVDDNVTASDSTWKTRFNFTGLIAGPNYGKNGVFFKHSSLKKFRMPWTEAMAERGLLDFDNYNTDEARVYDYPGGKQLSQVGQFTDNITIPKAATSATDAGSGRIVGGSTGNEPVDMNPFTVTLNTGKDNIVLNNGVIYGRRT